MTNLTNRVQLLGHVGKDPEVTYLDSGMAVAKITLATSDKYKNKQGEMVESTEWHNLVAWDKTAQTFEKHVKKGDRLLIEGKLQTKSWEKDGQKHYRTEIVVGGFQFLNSKKEGQPAPGTERDPASAVPAYQSPTFDPVASEEIGTPNDDLPF